jgi:DNA-binding NarL/FixJ family response regulator
MAAFPQRARVLIADDSEPIMREIEDLLSPEFDVVGKATNGIDLVAEATRLRPDLIVTDLEMPGLGGIDASRAALKERPGLPILLLTSHCDCHLVEEALGVGIRGYVLKLAAGDELIPAAHGALRGETFISPALR